MTNDVPVRDPAPLLRLEADVGSDVIPMLINAFEKELATTATSIHTSFAENNLSLLETKAHALKSAAASLGAMVLSDVCRSLELAARDKADLQTIEDMIGSLDIALRETREAFDLQDN